MRLTEQQFQQTTICINLINEKFCKMALKVIIDEKKYIILPYEDCKSLNVKADLNVNRKSLLTIDEAEAYSIELINKWTKEKS